MKNKTKNRIFQWLWFKIVQHFYRVGTKDPSNPVLAPAKRMNGYWDFGKKFGCKIHWFGHSNVEGGYELDIMNKFKQPVVNNGRGGSIAGNWLYFYLKTTLGKELYDKVNRIGVVNIIDILGNYLLKGIVNEAREDLQVLRAMFPYSIGVTMSPIHTELFLELVKNIPDFPYKTVEEVNKQIHILNGYLREMWGDFILDIAAVLTNPEDGKIWWFALCDIVHYSKEVQRQVYVRFIDAIVDLLRKVNYIND